MKLSTTPSDAMKKSEMKREASPYNPYKRKAKRKETSPGFYKNPLSPRERARTRKDARDRYRLAGAAAEELISILRAPRTDANRNLWAYYCYYHDLDIIFEKAYECASRQRQSEIRNATTAFQRWLTDTFGKELA